jgi:UDP-N-acetylmuramoylalanine--D-glutamate ligase
VTAWPACPEFLKNRRGRRCAVVGGGRTGAAAAGLLVREGASVVVCDDGALDVVTAGLTKHGLDTSTVELRAGGMRADALVGFDLVVLSPGVPRAHVALQAALAAGIPVVNELELGLAVLTDNGAHLDGVCLLGITGTNGKSTTTTMAGAIAKRRDPQAFVGGNLGLPLCAAILDGLVCGTAEAPRQLVVELSSYQLETLQWFPTTAAAVTNLAPDHLDRYPNVDAYWAAKARLLSLVVDGGGVSLNAADDTSTRTFGALVRGTVVPCHFDVSAGGVGIEVNSASLLVRNSNGQTRSFALSNPLIVGHHNRQNAAAAVALSVLSGAGDDVIVAGLADYAGIAHRLERVGAAGGVTWWNDSKATNVDAAVTALRSFDNGVHLIAGGVGKGAPYAPLVDAGRACVRAVYTIGADAPAIEAAFANVDSIVVIPCSDLATACTRANDSAVAGEHIVLSPACASFDQFRDYNHRGVSFREQFKSLASRQGLEHIDEFGRGAPESARFSIRGNR